MKKYLILLLLLIPSLSWGADLTPDIAVLPSATVRVGEEVVFNAEDTTYTPDQTLVRRGRFEWNFGDGYVFQSPMASPYTYIRPNGIAVSHFFMSPGTYTVTLTVKIWSVFSDIYDTYPCVAAGCIVGKGLDVTPDASGTTTVSITVSGKAPLTDFEIEHAPFYNRTKQYVYIQVPATYRTASYTLKLFTIDTTADPDVSTELLSKNNPTAEEPVLLDHTALTAGHAYILRAQILDGEGEQVVDGTKEGIFESFFTTPASTPKTTIDENNAFSHDGTKVFPIATFMVGSGEPEASLWATYSNTWNTYNTYGTTAQYATYVDTFASNVPTIMGVGPGRGSFQENGTSRPRHKVNHLPSGISDYVTAAKAKASMLMVNIQDEPNMGSSWEKALLPTLTAWMYVANAADPDHPFSVNFVGQEWLQNSAASYNDFQGSAPLFGGKKWCPAVIGADVYPAAGRFHAANTACNRADMGPWWAYLDGRDRIRSFNAMTSKRESMDYKDYRELIPIIPCGKPTPTSTVDTLIYGDSHTLSTGSHTFTIGPYYNIYPGMEVGISANTTSINISMLLTHRMFGTVTSYNPATGQLVCDITSYTGAGTYTVWNIQVEYPTQVVGETKYQGWLEVVHGAKGYFWFQNYGRSAMQTDEMAVFMRQITALWPYISGAVPETTVTDNANDKLNRVDTMIRESGGDKYIVAVRVTEPPSEPAIAWVKLSGTPSTVITSGKVRDTNGIIWSLPPTVTISGDGTVMVPAKCDTLGDISYVPYGMTTIETPTSGWTSVENAYGVKVELTGQSLTIPSSYPSSSTYTVNVGTGLSIPATNVNMDKQGPSYARYIRLARNDSVATRLTNYIWGNFVSYDTDTGVLTFALTAYKGGGTFTNWIVETEWYQQVVQATRYTGVEPTNLTPTFTISGLTGDTQIDVVDEGRHIHATDGVFQDDQPFTGFDVRIYTIGGITDTTTGGSDTTQPTVTAFTLPETASSLNVAISSFTCTDDTSVTGYCVTTANSSNSCVWSGTAPATKTFSADGTQTGYAWCRDAVGNISSTVSDTVDITTTEIYSLTVSVDAVGAGVVTSDVGDIDCGDVCTDQYEEDTVVTLTAAPSYGYSFTGWSGGGCSGTSTCVVTMTETKSVVAAFTPSTYTLHVTYPEDGTVITSVTGTVFCGGESTNCTYVLNSNTSLLLTATCATGYYNPLFSGDCAASSSCTLPMSEDHYISASCTSGTGAATDGLGTITLGPGGAATLGHYTPPTGANMGTENTEGTSISLISNRADCWAVQAPSSGTLTTAYVAHANTSAATAKVCVYSHDGDAPDAGDAKLGCSGAITSSVVEWKTASMDGGSVTAGSYYYMCTFVDNDSANAFNIDTSSATSTVYYKTNSGLYDAPGDTLSGGWNLAAGQRIKSVYVTITP